MERFLFLIPGVVGVVGGILFIRFRREVATAQNGINELFRIGRRSGPALGIITGSGWILLGTLFIVMFFVHL